MTIADGQPQTAIGVNAKNKKSQKTKIRKDKTMKNNKFSKISLIVLTITLCLGAAFAMNVSAEAPTPVIASKNIEYNTQFSLMYAVPASTVTSGASVTLYVHETEPTSEAAYAGGVSYTVNTVTPAGKPDEVEGAVGLNYDAYVFITDGITAKAFANNFYVVAKDNESGKFSKVVRYSVAEYLYERLATPDITSEQQLMYEGAIDFATGVQLSVGSDKLNATNDADKLIKNLRYVAVEGGTVGGYSTGLYPVGSTVQPSAEGVSTWNVVAYGIKGEQIATKNKVPSFEVPETEGLVSIKFTTNAVFTYTAGNNDFVDYTVDIDDVPESILTSKGNATAAFASDASHGTYIELNSNGAKGSMAEVFGYGSTVSEADATAFEVSFAFKLTTPQTNNNEYVTLNLQNGGTKIHSIALYSRSGGANTLTVAEYHSAGVQNKMSFDGTVASEWVYIRAVVYKGDPQVYVYVNGDTDNYYVSKALYGTTATDTFDGSDLSLLANVTLEAMSANYSAKICIDNYFCGYTKDTKPASHTAEQ